MYNRYLASAAAEAANTTPPPQREPQQQEQPREASHHTPQSASVFADLTHALSGRLQNIKLDMDTVLVLGIVWFLLSDGEETDWDLLLLVGGMLLFGI